MFADPFFQPRLQAFETVFVNKMQQSCQFRTAAGVFFPIMFDRHVVFELNQLFGNPCVVQIGQQRFAAFVLFDFAGMFQNALQRTELVDQFGCGFWTDSGNARHIVDAVAGKSLNIYDLFRVNAELFLDVFRREKFVFHRIVKFDAGTNQLHQVLVSGNDNDLIAFF